MAKSRERDKAEAAAEKVESNGGGEPSQPKKLSEAAERQLRAKLIAATFGEIVSVLMQHERFKHYSLADLEWLVVPPLLQKQFAVAEGRSKENGFSAPVGVALWASVSDEVDERLSASLERPIRLRPDEWKSGEHLWLIEAAGPPKIVSALIERLRTTAFAKRPFKLRTLDEAGKRTVRSMAPKGSEPSVA